MEIYQLRTFVAVAREGGITRASERLHLSQPAVSAHIKAIEETLGLALFERTPRGMTLTGDGRRLLEKAEQALAAHRELLDEAARMRGRPSGPLRLGAAAQLGAELLGRMVADLARRCPEVAVTLTHGASRDVLDAVRRGALDAGFYNEAGAPAPDLATVEVARFDIHLAAPPGSVDVSAPPDWAALAELTWICPASGSCCGHVAERLFAEHRFRPKQIVGIDRESVTSSLIAGGVGVGLLHADSAAEAMAEVDIFPEALQSVRVLFAFLESRAQDPLLAAACASLGVAPAEEAAPPQI